MIVKACLIAGAMLALTACASHQQPVVQRDPCGSKFVIPAYTACRVALAYENYDNQRTARTCLKTGQQDTPFCRGLLDKMAMH